jgi:hypothetical protein
MTYEDQMKKILNKNVVEDDKSEDEKLKQEKYHEDTMKQCKEFWESKQGKEIRMKYRNKPTKEITLQAIKDWEASKRNWEDETQ